MMGDAIRSAFGFRGDIALTQSVGLGTVTFFVDLDWQQVSLRRSDEVGALIDRGIINALWEIPEGVEYPISALPQWVLDRLDNRQVAIKGETVRRDLRPPLFIRAAAASGKSLRSLLADLGPLSAVCPTAAILKGRQKALTGSAVLDARLFGIGVGVWNSSGISVLSDAGSVTSEFGPYQWHLAETLFAQMERVS
jgi:hypothetical protein